MGWIAFWIVVSLLVGYLYGWADAHHTVATECERLGKFYVGKTVYECKSVKKVGED